MTALKKNISKNAVLSALNSCFSILFSLTTYPYAVRVLGVENIGKITYSASIITYFALVAALGIRTYAIREGAKRRDDPEALQTFASQMLTINLLSTGAAYLLLGVALFCFKGLRQYTVLILIQSLTMLLTTLGLDWLNNVFEDFLHITVRSAIAYAVSIVFLFIFVRDADDYYLYACLNVVNNLMICLLNFFYIRKKLKLRLARPRIKRHIGPIMVFCANSVAISVYVSLDTTVLGWFRGDYTVGLYAVPVKIYTIIKSVLSAIYAVAIPRLVSHVQKGEKLETKMLFSRMFSGLTLIMLPIAAGLACLAREAVVLVGGESYVSSVAALQLLCIAVIFSIYGGLVTACLNVALGRERDNLYAGILAAGANFALNLVMIPLFGLYGAAVTTIVAEAVVFLYCFIRIPNKRDYFDLREIGIATRNAALGCLPIVGVTLLVKYLTASLPIRIIVIMAASVLLYAAVLLLLRDKYVLPYAKKLLKKA